MRLTDRLNLAENIAADHKRWIEFSDLYQAARVTLNVASSIEKALREIGLWHEYCEKLSTRA